MPWSVFQIYGVLPAFLLVLFRVAGLVFAVPFLSGSVIPARIKVALTTAVSLAVFPVLMPRLPVTTTLASAMAGMLGELAIGLFVGLMVTLLFQGVQLAAQAIGQQSGMRLGSVFNPMLETSSTLVSQLYFLVALTIFFAVGGDHAVVRALLDSFTTIPPLAFEVTPGLVSLLVDMLALSFTMAIRVAGPTILALLLAFLVLGFLSRTIPQLNILTIGFPLKLAVALVMMAMTMMSLEGVLIDGLTECMDGIRLGLGLDAAS